MPIEQCTTATGAPEVLQALALRLQLQLWRASGRNFQRLQTALLGYAAPGTKPGLALRISRAACVRDVCAVDPDRGTELVIAVQVGNLGTLTKYSHVRFVICRSKASRLESRFSQPYPLFGIHFHPAPKQGDPG